MHDKKIKYNNMPVANCWTANSWTAQQLDKLRDSLDGGSWTDGTAR